MGEGGSHSRQDGTLTYGTRDCAVQPLVPHVRCQKKVRFWCDFGAILSIIWTDWAGCVVTVPSKGHWVSSLIDQKDFVTYIALYVLSADVIIPPQCENINAIRGREGGGFEKRSISSRGRHFNKLVDLSARNNKIKFIIDKKRREYDCGRSL